MPKKAVFKGTIEYLQILNEKGRLDERLMPSLTKNDVIRMYELMVFSRKLDDKLLALQRQGKIGTFAQVKGQEACQVGSCYAMKQEDWMFPAFRETAAFLTRGLPAEMIIETIAGDERGNKIPEDVNCFTYSVPVAGQILHAVGFAWGFKLRKERKAAVVFFGDGATSKGDFHEGLNFAGVFKIPIVFICQNNQYAISVPREKQTASETIAQKALAYGIDGIQVDGNDLFAVFKATQEALKNAKDGKGAKLIECVTYRLGDHTTADDASKYRTKKEVEEWSKKDPIVRIKKYLESKKYWKKEDEEKLLKKVEERINEAVEKAEKIGMPTREDMFKYMYKEMPWYLKEQLEEVKDAGNGSK
ncbi:pyruvate dehydrogenase (acetyl-transferring) E1 component subunit alpha [Candidatus Woesearchaeota archaeon]|nr:pyruvate dehydrogenase (acetyl-transferring) E1 component subunit alpha [Candidatus Woesearchaeota archaeon]